MEFLEKFLSFSEFLAGFTFGSVGTTLIVLFFPVDTAIFVSSAISGYTKSLFLPIVPYFIDFILLFTWENTEETVQEESFLSYYGPSIWYWTTTATAGYIFIDFLSKMQTLYSVHVNYLVRTFFTLLCPHDWRILFNYMGNYLHLYNFNMYVSFVQTFMDPTPAVMRGLISHLRHSSEILGIRSNYQLDNTLNNMTIIFIFVFWTSFSLGMGYCLS